MRGWEGLPPFSKELYQDTYFLPGEDYEGWLYRITEPYQNDQAHGDRIRDDIRNYYAHPSTPISSGRGLPISCYVSHVGDTRESIIDHYREGMWLGAEGGGRGVYWSDVRGSGASINGTNSTSSGLIPFLGISDRATYGISQAGVRRSSETAYIHVSHPDIKDFLDIRLETGDRNRRTPNLHHAVVIPDAFMEAVENLEMWDLICPNTKEVVASVDAYDLFMDILEVRKMESGEPNLLFIDTVNRLAPKEYRVLDLKVVSSNICTEIMLYTDADTTAICCLASLNLEYWDEYKDSIQQKVSDWTDFLDNVLQVFIYKTKGREGFERARKSAMESRDIGLGVMGWHSLLQRKNIPFESPMAKGLNIQIFTAIRDATDYHQRYGLSPETDPCPMSMKVDKDRRNIHTLAVAPTMSISTLCNLTSSGIEPWMANEFVKKVPTGSYTIRNKYLDAVIREYAVNSVTGLFDAEWYEAQWKLVTKAKGSVRLLHWMEDYQKDVFKTAYELDQRALITQAADRAPLIDQGQSLNIFVPAKTSYEELYALHMMAWKLGVKSLYYLRSEPASYADTGSIERKPITLEDDSCIACT